MEPKLFALLNDGVDCLEAIYNKLAQPGAQSLGQTLAHHLVDLWSALEASRGLLDAINKAKGGDFSLRVSCSALVSTLRGSYEEASRIALKDGLIFREQALFSRAQEILEQVAQFPESGTIQSIISA